MTARGHATVPCRTSEPRPPDSRRTQDGVKHAAQAMQQLREAALKPSLAAPRCQPVPTGLPLTESALYSTFQHSEDDGSTRMVSAFGQAVTRAERHKAVVHSVTTAPQLSTQAAAGLLFEVRCVTHNPHCAVCCNGVTRSHTEMQSTCTHDAGHTIVDNPSGRFALSLANRMNV